MSCAGFADACKQRELLKFASCAFEPRCGPKMPLIVQPCFRSLRCACALIAAIAISACASSVAPVQQMRYVDVSHTFVSIMERSEFVSRSISNSAEGELTSADSGGWEGYIEYVVGCSDQVFRCTRIGTNVFAVPKDGISSEAYSASGMRFRVEKCLREAEGRCVVALLSGTCERFSEVSESGEQLCELRSTDDRSGAESVAYVLYFIFNQDVGVTAFGRAPSHQASEAAQFEVLTQSVLASDYGILCCRPQH